MKSSDVETLLTGFGFTKTDESNFGEHYALPVGNGFSITAYASHAGSFFDTKKSDTVEKVNFSLQSKGTVYRCLSLKGIQDHFAEIRSALTSVSQNPSLLKCPECGTRDVHLIEPKSGGKKFRPFLSCDGMYVEGKGEKKHTVCRGTSDALPALVIYP